MFSCSSHLSHFCESSASVIRNSRTCHVLLFISFLILFFFLYITKLRCILIDPFSLLIRSIITYAIIYFFLGTTFNMGYTRDDLHALSGFRLSCSLSDCSISYSVNCLLFTKIELPTRSFYLCLTMPSMYDRC